mmetsp:Transcript_15299/g.27237  ORF Transcript_15299/g.27237 Transcript_15299/m.27237 type:complete len:119 (+) Transcript_15299:120-476(+)
MRHSKIIAHSRDLKVQMIEATRVRNALIKRITRAIFVTRIMRVIRTILKALRLLAPNLVDEFEFWFASSAYIISAIDSATEMLTMNTSKMFQSQDCTVKNLLPQASICKLSSTRKITV